MTIIENFARFSECRRKSGRGCGSVLILCTVLVLGLGLTVVATYAFTRSVGQSTVETVAVRRARLLAQSGIDYAIVQVWDDYLAQNGGSPGSPTDYRTFLEDQHSRTPNPGHSLDQCGNSRRTSLLAKQPPAGRNRGQFRERTMRIRADRVYSFHRGLLAVGRSDVSATPERYPTKAKDGPSYVHDDLVDR